MIGPWWALVVVPLCVGPAKPDLVIPLPDEHTCLALKREMPGVLTQWDRVNLWYLNPLVECVAPGADIPPLKNEYCDWN